MNWTEAWEYAQWADTAVTVAQLALFIGCPTAGATWLVARVVLKSAAKATIKRIALKRMAIAATAGVVATAAAAFQSGSGGGAGGAEGGETIAGLPFSASELSRTTVSLIVELHDGSPQYVINDDPVDRDQLSKRLLIPAAMGQLREVRFENRLPPKQHGEWVLHAEGTLQALVQMVPEVTVEKSARRVD